MYFDIKEEIVYELLNNKETNYAYICTSREAMDLFHACVEDGALFSGGMEENYDTILDNDLLLVEAYNFEENSWEFCFQRYYQGLYFEPELLIVSDKIKDEVNYEKIDYKQKIIIG